LVLVGKAITEKKFDAANPWNSDRVAVYRLLEQDIKKQIHCVGFVHDEDLVVFYNSATVFVMPSLYEGFGLPVLEAMQCGCPVVTSDEGSLAEVAGSAAYFIDAYSSGSIANGITKVFHDEKLREKLSEEGLINAKKFSWKKTAEETLQVYQSGVK